MQEKFKTFLQMMRNKVSDCKKDVSKKRVTICNSILEKAKLAKKAFSNMKQSLSNLKNAVTTKVISRCNKISNKMKIVSRKIKKRLSHYKRSLNVFWISISTRRINKVKSFVQRIMNRFAYYKKVAIIAQVRKSKKIRHCFEDEYFRLTGTKLTPEQADNKINVAVRLRFKGIKNPLDLFRTVRVFEYTLRSYGCDVDGALQRAYKCFNLSKVYNKRDLLGDDVETRNQLLARNLRILVDKELSMDSKYQKELENINSKYELKLAANSDIENTWKLKNLKRNELNVLYEEYFKKYEPELLAHAHKMTNYDMTSLKIMLGLNE